MFRIHMLPAETGDSFLIEAGDSAISRVLVDCGTAAAWKANIFPAFSGTDLALDLLVITHIDQDHIGGAIELFSQKERYPLTIGEVWFNGLPQMLFDKPEESTPEERQILSSRFPPVKPTGLHRSDISFSQGISLSALLYDSDQPWNAGFHGQAVSGQCPPVILAGSVKITPILPTQASLQGLFAGFQKELRRSGGDVRFHNSPALQAAFERFCCCHRPAFIERRTISRSSKTDIASLAGASVSPDPSLTNASSIGFVLEFQNRSILFLGDAVPGTSIDALRQWQSRTGKPLYFDAVKMPHHGSKRNCMELLDHVDSPLFFISSNGTQYDHPGPETIAKIVTRPTGRTRRLVFNYPHSVYHRFHDSELMNAYHYDLLTAGIVDLTEDFP